MGFNKRRNEVSVKAAEKVEKAARKRRQETEAARLGAYHDTGRRRTGGKG